jgi:hypothetical protein
MITINTYLDISFYTVQSSQLTVSSGCTIGLSKPLSSLPAGYATNEIALPLEHFYANSNQ